MCEYHDISGAQSRQRFPVNGLVAQSRIAYQTAPLLRHEIRPGLFVFAGAGGAVTAVAGVEAVAVVDKGYGPRVPEIRRVIAAALPLEPKWLIDTHWHFDHTDGNAAFAAAGATIARLPGHASHDRRPRPPSHRGKLTAPEIIAAQPTAEFDGRWGTGYVTGPHFTRMVLAGLGMSEMPGRFAARSCVSNVTKFSKPEIVA